MIYLRGGPPPPYLMTPDQHTLAGEEQLLYRRGR
jgi:hypothetical protein